MTAEETAARAPTAPEALEAWNRELRLELEGLSLNLSLIGVPPLEPEAAQVHFRRLLAELLRLLGGERGFLVALQREGEGKPEPSRILCALDVDGDVVPEPESKVPRDLVERCAVRRAPEWRPLERNERHGAVVALPCASRGVPVAAAVIENRFRDLELETARLQAAKLYLDSLAGQLDLASVVEENEGLLRDVLRVRENLTEQGAVVVPPKVSRRPKRPPRRDGLKGDYSMIIGSSPRILEILEVIDRISNSSAPVLIQGESGTGKELIALAVHKNSPRADKPFVSENCAAITETLLESELFGYVKGAFTGATKDHKGLFEQAEGGTLFLDEVGDMSPSMQKKLLRVLQEGVIRRVGGKEFIPVNVRIISATNKDLLAECRAGNFREDLYYRLNVISFRLPPLRERREDIPDLVEHFLEELAEETGVEKKFEPQAIERLMAYDWPGNIRELQNEVKKVFALADGDVIRVTDLSEHLESGERLDPGRNVWYREFAHLTLREATERLEREMIRRALLQAGGNKSLVAKTLKIPKTSLYNKIHKYKL